LGVDRMLAPSAAGAGGGRAIPLRRGDEAAPGVLVLWPPPGLETAGANDGSLALHLRSGGDSVLILGDLETRGLAGLLAAGAVPPSDTLVVPHHGARNAALADLL